MRCCFALVAFPVLFALAPAAHGEDDAPLRLKLDRTFNVKSRTSNATPAFITAQRLEGQKGSQLQATGAVELRKDGRTIYADRLLYQQDTKDVSADGSVRIEQDGTVMAGPHLEYNLETHVGGMSQPTFRFGENNSRGSAEALHIEGKQNYTLYNATYTTCPENNDDWLVRTRELDIDRATQIGVAHGATVDFKGVPILYTPWMDFALNNGRKTGFLGPMPGYTTAGGYELTVPFYWNIAPNRDATIAPRVISKRGLMLNDEFRYLEPNYFGEAHLDVLPQDQLAGRTRLNQSLRHMQNFGDGFSGSLNLNRVSDDAYFRDLSTSVAGTSQVNLLREGVVNYAGGWWNASTRVQTFQTLQDPLAPVTIPYRRTPQVTVNAQHPVEDGSGAFAGEFVSFTHPTAVNGERLVLYPNMSYPLVSDPAYYVTPKVGVHATYYALGANNAAATPNSSRTVPILSLDSGMTFERDAAIAGRGYVQTMEPRAYYVYIPYRNQDMLPNFDSALAPLSFAQMFTENRFFGSDRIGDANQVTLALTSRFLEAANGIERLKVAVAERFSFVSPRVNLVAPPVTGAAAPVTPTTPTTPNSKSDILLGISGKVTNTLSLDALLQYNPVQAFTEMYNYSLRYQPEAGKVFNLGYRFTNPNLIAGPSMRQIDMSEQWQLSGRWGTVARWNYSLLEKRLLEALLGVEYNRACWTTRLVVQRFTTATQQVSTGLFIQLELNDLVRVGTGDPLDALRRSVPGYTKMTQSPQSTQPTGLQ